MQAALFTTLTQQRAGALSLDDCGKAIAHRHAKGHSTDAMSFHSERLEYESEVLSAAVAADDASPDAVEADGGAPTSISENPLSAGVKDPNLEG